MSQESEKETTTVAEAPVEAEVSAEATGDTEETAITETADEVADVEHDGAGDPSEAAETESVVAEAEEAPASAEVDETPEAEPEEAAGEAPEAAVAVEEPAVAEVDETAEAEPEEAAGEAPDAAVAVEEPAVAEVDETAEAEPEEAAGEAPDAAVAATEESAVAQEEPEAEEAEAEAKAERKPKKKESKPKIPLDELQAGTDVTGRVVGIADFGAFVDIGAETDGLIHISELSEGRVKKVTDVVSIGQGVDVWIKDVDVDQERISLSMKPRPKYRLRDLKPGMIVEGTVTGIRNYGVFVDIGSETEGLVHVSEMAEGYVDNPSALVSTGDDIDVRVKKVDRRRRRISLSMKGLGPSAPPPTASEDEGPSVTAMELAMRRALGELEEEVEETSDDVEAQAEEPSRDELGDVFSRMLREYRKPEEE